MPKQAEVTIGSYWVPKDGSVSSSVKVLAISDQGVKMKRMNLYYGGEEFFLNWHAFESSQWISTPDNTQIAFL